MIKTEVSYLTYHVLQHVTNHETKYALDELELH
jgi:hypothetical protein